MATLTVKNVGPIREAEFEVKKYTVFIGPQGSGKSTLAKLIAIGGDFEKGVSNNHDKFFDEYNIVQYVNYNSTFAYETNSYNFYYNNAVYNFIPKELTENDLKFTEETVVFAKDIDKMISDLEKAIDKQLAGSNKKERSVVNLQVKHKDARSRLEELRSRVQKMNRYLDLYSPTYITAERSLVAILANSLWNLIQSKASLPEGLIIFASQFEVARKTQSLEIQFLEATYAFEKDKDLLVTKSGVRINLDQSASGFQSIIPLLSVVEHQRKTAQRRFIIEEPELNLYPTAQKDLMYNLVSGLDRNAIYQDAEWVFTTHSPYVLSSLNTLILAYKVAHQSEENRAKVEAIIPSRHWINPNDFAAYYVDGGTVRSIVSESTGLISESELDDVSENLAGEQDQLLDLYRSALHA